MVLHGKRDFEAGCYGSFSDRRIFETRFNSDGVGTCQYKVTDRQMLALSAVGRFGKLVLTCTREASTKLCTSKERRQADASKGDKGFVVDKVRH